MNRKPLLFNIALTVLTLSSGFSQKKTKTYEEVFNVGEDAVLELNTSHADIEFETWDKDQVEIVATVTLEGASDEEVDDYFKSGPFRIVGNSSQIEVTTSGRRSWNVGLGNNMDFDFNFDVEPFFLDLEIPDLPELAVIPEMPPLPPMPPIPYSGFDYGRYKEEGEAYMREWKKEFEKSFDREYKERMEEWGKRAEERAKAWEERNAKQLEERERRLEERASAMEKRKEEVERRRAEALEKRVEARERMAEARERVREERKIFISRDDDDRPNVFFYSSDADNKKYKVKKSIKIRMPKSVRLKMNVKHGEVKLAATTRDINASLRHASLLASTIEGDNTLIKASYSPVVVNNWSYGQLKTYYSKRVNLKEVGELRLNAVSSNIVIDKLKNKAFIANNLGKLSINSIHPGFSDVKVSVQNGEVVCKIPNSPVSFYLNGLKSTMDYPDDVQMNKEKDWDNVILKGFKGKDNSGKQISINSKYSQVLLEN